jgi:hypothetical protein
MAMWPFTGAILGGNPLKLFNNGRLMYPDAWGSRHSGGSSPRMFDRGPDALFSIAGASYGSLTQTSEVLTSEQARA